MAPTIISSTSIPPVHRPGEPLRFSLGTRVEVCYDRTETAVSVSRIENGEWVPATIIGLDYRQGDWCPGFCAAYLARLDVPCNDEDRIVVRDDDGRCVRLIFDAGMKVAIDGLQKRKDLNGKTAAVIKFKPGIGRYRVELLDGSGEKVAVRRTNLRDADESLFAEPPSPPDCAICLLPMPHGPVQASLQMCCGQTICAGCIMTESITAPFRPCPLCRQPTPNNDESLVKMTRERIDSGDGNACVSLGGFYMEGFRGLPRDVDRGLQFWRRGAELGSVSAQYNVALVYMNGQGNVEIDPDMAMYFLEQAAKGGHVLARSYLGQIEANAALEVAGEERQRLMRRAAMHYLISAKAGDDFALERVKAGFRAGVATKEEFAAALRQHKESKDETKSEARDRASAAYTTAESMANADRLRVPHNV